MFVAFFFTVYQSINPGSIESADNFPSFCSNSTILKHLNAWLPFCRCWHTVCRGLWKINIGVPMRLARHIRSWF